MTILIGTPVYNGLVTTAYMASVMKLIWAFGERDAFQVQQPSATRIDVARNLMATTVLNQPEFTHLLFVDSDMGFEPALVAKMIDHQKPVVGAIYPKRDLPVSFVPSAGLDNASTTPTGFIKVDTCGTGIMLIQRAALEAMAKRIPELWSTASAAPYSGGPVFQAFSPLQDDNRFMHGDDISFCLRWTLFCGGEIWACANETIEHIGPHTFRGRYLKP